MKATLLIALGFLLCLLSGFAFFAYQMATHPLGAITNVDYPSIEVSREGGNKLFDLKKGESKLLEYGEYSIEVPQLKTTVHLFKNNRGNCYIRRSDGVVVVEVDENASIFSSPAE